MSTPIATHLTTNTSYGIYEPGLFARRQERNEEIVALSDRLAKADLEAAPGSKGYEKASKLDSETKTSKAQARPNRIRSVHTVERCEAREK